jgi:uncharacterized protein YkwD
LARLLLGYGLMLPQSSPFPRNGLRCLALLFACIALFGCGTPHKITQRETASPELVQLERRVHQLVNQYRLSKNLPPLTPDGIITQQARIHSRAMATREATFGHEGFRIRVKRISAHLPYKTAAENVAFNRGYSDCAHQAVREWLKSAQHHKNIRGNYRLTGIGVAKGTEGGYYFTQIFWL